MTDIVNQKELIDDVITFLEAAVTSGAITTGTKIFKGIQQDLEQIGNDVRTYIAIDDGGERTETEDMGSEAQKHFFSILVEIGAQSYKNLTDALDKNLVLSKNVKNTFELKANKQGDGMTFGITITPVTVTDDKKFWWRLRQVIIDYHNVEDKYEEF